MCAREARGGVARQEGLPRVHARILATSARGPPASDVNTLQRWRPTDRSPGTAQRRGPERIPRTHRKIVNDIAGQLTKTFAS